MTAIGRSLLAVVFGIVLLYGMGGSPAEAHGKEKHQKTEQVQRTSAEAVAATDAKSPNPSAEQQPSQMMDDMDMDRSEMSFLERLVAWFGRLHPAIVHFPIAFFPAAWFTAIVGRKRPAFSAPVQFLVVAGGIFAPVAALAGWINGMTADPEPILTYHRWLGVAIGLTGAGLGWWAWKRPWEDRGAGMIAALTVMTVAIAVQGFLGASVTHGFEHLMF